MRAEPVASAIAGPGGAEARADDGAIQDAAIAWMVELRSGEATVRTRQAFERWLAAHPAHQAAWRKLDGALGHAFGDLPAATLAAQGQRAAVLETTLRGAGKRQAGRRRLLRSALAAAGVGAGLGWLVPRAGRQAGLMPDLYADLATGTGQRRQVTLPDGSLLTLDARSSVDLDFSGGQRLVRLRQGQLIVSVQPDQAAPFIVQTTQGQARALGTRYLVRQAADQTWVDVLEHRVAVSARDGQAHVLQAGQGARIGDDGRIALLTIQHDHSEAWARGLFIAHDQPLAELVEALRPYHAGFIRVSARAAGLRLTGRYVLDDVPATLAALADTLPLAVQQRVGGWLIQIDTKS